jgi:uncharacterized metal-binding protein/predicted Fe-Mo cluster-binding NifX family protein
MRRNTTLRATPTATHQEYVPLWYSSDLLAALLLHRPAAMRIAIPAFGTRVAPNFTHSDRLLVGRVNAGRVVGVAALETGDLTEDERLDLLEEHRVSMLACGGIDHELVVELRCRGIEVINNVAGETEHVLEHAARGQLREGHGISHQRGGPTLQVERPVQPELDPAGVSSLTVSDSPEEAAAQLDCLACPDRVCLRGQACGRCPQGANAESVNAQLRQLMEVAIDIAAEPERVLCRIAELIYFCVEMHYRHVGLAFCADLLTETETVARLLARFVRVTAVSCRLGGPWEQQEYETSVSCNPFAMARALNDAQTELNVIIGLSVGCDMVFARLSQAPITTLFVKDKLLANNPVSAVHSRYVLERILARP